jgi:3-phenylpropionate/trans-cinnamate dioxygenase ferredoxin subunit
VNEKLPRGKTSMAENDWIYVTDESDLSDGKMMPVYPLGVHVLLAKVDDLIYALSGKCVHMACPLYTGTLEGNILTCPCHDWRYNIKTGEFLDATELRLETYQMKSENGKLFIMLTKGEL